MQTRQIVPDEHLRPTHSPCAGGYLNNHPVYALTICLFYTPLPPPWLILSVNWRSYRYTGNLSPMSNLSLDISSSLLLPVMSTEWSGDVVCPSVVGTATCSSYPSPVERPSQVIPSPQWKHPHRRLWAQLQLIQDGEDPAHLQTHWGPEERKERQ